jgi:hypothetical protein
MTLCVLTAEMTSCVLMTEMTSCVLPFSDALSCLPVKPKVSSNDIHVGALIDGGGMLAITSVGEIY